MVPCGIGLGVLAGGKLANTAYLAWRAKGLDEVTPGYEKTIGAFWASHSPDAPPPGDLIPRSRGDKRIFLIGWLKAHGADFEPLTANLTPQSPKQKAAIASILDSLSFEKPGLATKVEDVFYDLEQAAPDRLHGHLALNKMGEKGNKKAIVLNRAREVLAGKGLAGLLKEMGIAPTEGLLNRITAIERALLRGGASFLNLKLPENDPLRDKMLKDPNLVAYLNTGLDNAYPSMSARYGKDAKFNLYWGILRADLMLVVMASAVAGIVQQIIRREEEKRELEERSHQAAHAEKEKSQEVGATLDTIAVPPTLDAQYQDLRRQMESIIGNSSSKEDADLLKVLDESYQKTKQGTESQAAPR